MSDIVERLKGDVQYEWRQIMREAAAEIERLRARVAELEAECDRLQSLANVYRTEVMASRNERAAFFSRTMNYEQWQAASRQVEIARADTAAALTDNWKRQVAAIEVAERVERE